MTMPTYTELVDMVAQLEKKTVVMASMVESKQTRRPPPPFELPRLPLTHGLTSRVFFYSRHHVYGLFIPRACGLLRRGLLDV